MDFDGEIYKSVLEDLPVGVYLVDRDRRIVSWNSGAEKLTGYLRQEVIGRCCAEGLLMHCGEDNVVMCGDACPLAATMRDGQPREAGLFLLHKEGQRVPVRVQAQPIRDSRGVIVGAAECFDARTVLPAAAAHSQAEGPRLIDSATDLPERGATIADLNAALADFARTQVPFGVLCLAIDNVDALLHKDGRKAVDAVLYATAQTLRANLAPGDSVGRWSADRFVAILTGCAGAALAQAAEMLQRRTVAEAVPWWGDRLSVSVSIGAAAVREGDTPKTLMERAEKALEAARASGCGALEVA